MMLGNDRPDLTDEQAKLLAAEFGRQAAKVVEIVELLRPTETLSSPRRRG
jgi:hypothetical protein